MSRFVKYFLLSGILLTVLACGITAPISQAQDLASTAESMVTSMPIETLKALPSSVPNLGNYLDPNGKPVTIWNNLPIMPQATAGQEYNSSTYSFKASGVTATDVQTFYTTQLKKLGWSTQFNAEGGNQGGVMLFSKDSNLLSITIVTSGSNGVVVNLFLQ